jgi:hypothetical protein
MYTCQAAGTVAACTVLVGNTPGECGRRRKNRVRYMQNRNNKHCLVSATTGMIIEPWATAQIDVYDKQQRA